MIKLITNRCVLSKYLENMFKGKSSPGQVLTWLENPPDNTKVVVGQGTYKKQPMDT